MRITFMKLLLFVVLLVACSDPAAPAPTGTSPDTGAAVATATAPAAASAEALPPPVPATTTAIPASPTPTEPLAATVNGQPILLSTFEQELARYEQGQALLSEAGAAVEDETNHRQAVLDALIERALIEQAAAANGIVITPEMVSQKVAELQQAAAETGGEGSFEAWLAANQWTEETFREDLAYEMLAERVSALVTADVPDAVPHVRARYIEVADQTLAQSLLEQIRGGTDFAAVAREYSLGSNSQDGGDLGYFPAGGLTVPEIEQAAFALEPEEVSEVIAVPDPAGNGTSYYLVQVLDVDQERALEPNFRSLLLEQTFEEWLTEQWNQAEIVRFIDTGV